MQLKDRVVHPEGYIGIKAIDRPTRFGTFSSGRYVYEHVLVIEQEIGRFLHPPEEVHHWNENRADNRAENLHLCADKKEHKKIHKRMRVILAGGNPDTDKICSRCRKPKHLDAFRNCPSSFDGKGSTCKPCHADEERERKIAKRITT